jgi:hypothetical protein
MWSAGDRVPESQLISNGHQYTRLLERPDGSRNLMGGYGVPYVHAQNPITPGFYSYLIPADAAYFSPAAAPSGTTRVMTTMQRLHQMQSSCDGTTARSTACMSASARMCRYSYGYADGWGPVELASGNASIECVGSDAADRKTVPFTTLSSYISGCSGPSVAMSVSCNAAVNRYCKQAGYASGLGIEELSSTAATFSCVSSASAVTVAVPWSSLTVGSCSLANLGTPGVCMTAANRYCAAHGYAAGYGVQEASSSAGQVVCLR